MGVKEFIMHNVRKNYILNLLNRGERLDERKFDEYREIEIKTGVIETAEGSAYARIGNTQVIAGVKFEIVEPFPSDPELGVFITNAELSPMASSKFDPGPPDERSIEFARVVDRAIRSAEAIDLASFFIEEGKVLGLFLDLYVMDFDGNMVDAASLAALAALRTTRIPKIEEGKLIREESQGRLKLANYPVSVSFAKIENHIILDPTMEEESASDARLSIGNIENYVVSMQKFGNGGFKKDEVLNMVNLAFEKGRMLRRIALRGEDDA